MPAKASPRASRSLASLVQARADLLRAAARHPAWSAIEARLGDRLRAHFAADPPRLQRLDGRTRSVILNNLIRYEAVHEILSLHDLRRRLQADRRCYGLFSPFMPDEPLVFTELALARSVVTDVGTILDPDAPVADQETCTCAMFYSISACHDGLRGVPFGGLLIRNVLDRLQHELPWLNTFATVSPVPGVRPWLNGLARKEGGRLREIVGTLDSADWFGDEEIATRMKAALVPLCASYMLDAKRGAEPLDPVARFHLGNGARLERINWLGDRSRAGLNRSAGFTANYTYDPGEMDSNHDFYQRTRAVVAAGQLAVLAHGASWYLA